MAAIRIKRGTRAQIDAAKAAGTLAAGEPYLITDESAIAAGTATDAYAVAAKSDHDHSANKLVQANTHESADTDVGATSLHHTIGTGANQAAAGNHGHVREATVREIWIDAAAMAPRTTNGATAAKRESSTNKVNTDVYSFDGSTEQGVQFKLSLPSAWNIGSVKLKAYWDADTGASAGNGVTWGFSAYAESDNDTIDTAFPAATTVDDTVLAVGKVHISAATAAITIGGTPQLGDLVWFQVARVVSAANDNMTQAALLLGVKLQYTESTTAPAAWS